MANEQQQTLVFADETSLQSELQLADPQALQPDPTQDSALAEQADDVIKDLLRAIVP